jgi:pyrimidine operon attenuation protein/uracil phosphoribosyltransferase
MGKKIVDQICEKIKPHLTVEFQSGRLNVKDFRDLLKRIEFTSHERKYLGANFRFVITKLGLFHYLPEIQGNEDAAVFQLVEVVAESWISLNIVKNRNEAINRIIEQIKERFQASASTLMTVSETGDLRISLQSLRENVTRYWETHPDRVPEFIEEFRDTLSETSQSSRLLYDIATYNRNIKSKNIRHLEDVLETIDEWEQRLHLDI